MHDQRIRDDRQVEPAELLYPPHYTFLDLERVQQISWASGVRHGVRLERLRAAEAAEAAAAHAAAVEVIRAAAEHIGAEHDERRVREAAGLARARARWERQSVGLVAGGGDAA